MGTDNRITFGDDAPKAALGDDSLNYAPFAKRIANAIVGLNAPGGYVIGLHGKWGSGKSTVLNFVTEHLKQREGASDETGITTIEFRPWLIAGHQDLIAAYFKVLSEELDDTPKKRLCPQWLRRFPAKTDMGFLVDPAIKMSLALADPTGAAMVAKVAPTVGKVAGKVLNQMKKNPSLQKAYRDLHDKLSESDNRILVLIDDIDRLRAEDVRSIMQMVKSVGQLPNVIYLLAYDREIVWSAFGKESVRAGPSFVEKIVQQELQLPVPSQTSLLRMLETELSFLLEGTENSLRWEHIVQDGLRRWIQSPRDVVRLSNAVKFSSPALEGEIDPQDLLAMEGLRLFDYEAFEWLRGHRDFLFTKGRFRLAPEDLKAQTVGSFQETVSDSNWSQIRSLAIQLFPQMSKDLKETVTLSDFDPDEVRKRRGIGSEAGFDSYFGLYPSPDAIRLETVNGLVSGDKTKEAIEARLRKHIRRMNSQGEPLIEGLLYEMLIRFRGNNPVQPSQAMLDALFAVGEEVMDIDYRPRLVGMHPMIVVDELIREMLFRWGPKEAGVRLIEAFERADSVAFLADVYVSCGRDLELIAPFSRVDCPISKTDFEKLGQVLTPKISAALRTNALGQAPYFYNIVRAWSHLTNSDKPKQWLMQGALESDEFMARTCLGLVVTRGGHLFEMMESPSSEFYDVETLLVAGRMHQGSETLTDDQRNRIAAVVMGCENLISEQDKSGTD